MRKLLSKHEIAIMSSVSNQHDQQQLPQLQPNQLWLENDCEVLKQRVRKLEEECDRLQRSAVKLQAERDNYQMTAYALALEHFTLEELQNFSPEDYVKPLAQVIEDLEREFKAKKDA